MLTKQKKLIALYRLGCWQLRYIPNEHNADFNDVGVAPLLLRQFSSWILVVEFLFKKFHGNELAEVIKS